MPTAPQPIVVRAAPVAGRAVAATNNSAVQLAQQLSGFNTQAQETILRVGERERERQEGRAARDALLAQGAALGDAVRDGTIEATQNPWYITAYNQEAAAISARRDLTSLQTQALQWEERNDPEAFQRRWAEESGAIIQGFSSADQFAGAEPVLREISSQVINANVARNVNRIENERTNNVSSLLAARISSINTENAGNASPEAVFSGIDDLRQNWFDTGGSQAEWDSMVASAVTTAAYGSRDSDLLDVLRFERGDAGSIYNQAGVADAVENDRFRIQSAADAAATARYSARLNEIRAEGQAATDAAYQSFGDSILTGDVNVEQFTSTLRQQGFSARAVSDAFDAIQRTIADVDALQTAQLEGGDTGAQVLSLFTRAQTQGYSQELEEEVANRILAGEMTSRDGVSFMRAAFETERRLQREAEEGAQRGLSVSSASAMREASRDLAALAAEEISRTFGDRVSDTRTTNFQTRIRNAALRIRLNGGSWDEAMQAARSEAAAIISEADPVGRRQQEDAEVSSPSAAENPRR